MNAFARFAKMNGLGNEIIVADMRARSDVISTAAAVFLANDPLTTFDQIMAIHEPVDATTDYRLQIINRDGSTAKACGNGTRCVVSWLFTQTGRQKFTFATEGGPVTAQRIAENMVVVNMGRPRLSWQEIPVSRALNDTNHVAFPQVDLPEASLVSMGNPHAVFFVNRDVYSFDLGKIGPMLEYDALFPERCNISIAEIIERQRIKMRTWERGAGLTKACGTAACAAAVAGVRRNLSDRDVVVEVPSGTLRVNWSQNGDVLMSGATEYEFAGLFDPLTGEYQKV